LKRRFGRLKVKREEKKRGCEGRNEENGKKKTLASNCELML